jgi:hypothetical protein
MACFLTGPEKTAQRKEELSKTLKEGQKFAKKTRAFQGKTREEIT